MKTIFKFYLDAKVIDNVYDLYDDDHFRDDVKFKNRGSILNSKTIKKILEIILIKFKENIILHLL